MLVELITVFLFITVPFESFGGVVERLVIPEPVIDTLEYKSRIILDNDNILAKVYLHHPYIMRINYIYFIKIHITASGILWHNCLIWAQTKKTDNSVFQLIL